MTKIIEYDVALSFAGEDRNYVDQVAKLLKDNKVKVFYDPFEQSTLWGKNLYEHLSDVYSKKARYTIMFISKHYIQKVWTNLERQAMQSRAMEENEEYILPVRFDDTEIPGLLSTVGYLSLANLSPEAFCEIVLEKISKSGTHLNTSSKLVHSSSKSVDIREISIYSKERVKQAGRLVQTEVTLKFNVENHGKEIVRDYKLIVFIPKIMLRSLSPYERSLINRNLVNDENGYFEYSLNNDKPLFPNDKEYMFNITFPVRNTDTNIFDEPIDVKLVLSNGRSEKRFELKDEFQKLGF